MSAQLTMKNRVNKEKRCSLDKCLSLWYNLSTEIENIFSVLFIAFDETLLTQLPHLSPPQNYENSSPGNHASAGKRTSGHTCQRTPWLPHLLAQADRNAAHSMNSYLDLQYQHTSSPRV